jgi:hypothetical protein
VELKRSSEKISDKIPDFVSIDDLGDTGEWIEERWEEGVGWESAGEECCEGMLGLTAS